jgi:nucleoid-associated protein YgaU
MALVADVQPATAPSPAQAAPNGSTPTTATDPSPGTSTYVVQRNDTLWGFAVRELGDPLHWSEIYALNQSRQECERRVHLLRDAAASPTARVGSAPAIDDNAYLISVPGASSREQNTPMGVN